MKNRGIQRKIKGRYKHINGFSVFAGGSCTEVVWNIGRAMKYLKDNVLSKLLVRVTGPLRDISNEEPAEHSFAAE